MKKIYYIIFSIALVSCGNKTKVPQKKDWQKALLLGKVKKTTEKNYGYRYQNDSAQVGEMLGMAETLYNDKGNKTEKSVYHGNEQLDMKSVFKYDSEDKNIENIEYGADGQPSRIIKFIYNDDGDQAQVDIANNKGEAESKVEKKYDSKGQEIERKDFKPLTMLSGRAIYKYDEKGNDAESYYYHPDGSLINKFVRKFDAKNNMTELYTYDMLDSLISKSVYKYDDYGNVLMAYRYRSDGSLSTSSRFSYEYDAQHNWIKRIEYNTEGRPVRQDIRAIEYYK